MADYPRCPAHFDPTMALVSYDAVSIPLMGLSLFLTYLIGSFVYATQFHPLHEIPGPNSAACSRIPYWFAALKGDSCSWLVQLHARYGPNDLRYADSGQAWKDIYGPETKGRKENPQSVAFFGPTKAPVHNRITANGPDHNRARRVLAPAFSERALKQQEPLFRRYADVLVAVLREQAEADGAEGVNMVAMFNFCTFDIMSDLTFGEPLGLLEHRKYTPWVERMFRSITVLPLVQLTEYNPVLRTHTRDRVDAHIRRGGRPGQPDIRSLVLAAGDRDRGLFLDEMHANAEIFMTAGTETSATLLSGCEIRGAFATESDEHFEGLAALPYLNACVEEALRIYPPVSDMIPRIIPEGGNVILDKWTAPGVSKTHQSNICLGPPYRLIPVPANFKNPNTFAPERWLGDPEYKDDQRDAFQPFICGPRNCLGQNMTYHEIRLLAAKVFFNFDLELCDDSRDWREQKVFVLWEKKPLLCKLRAVTK
ncbi:cytochrome P450 [Apiospora phragmitis]|uniref:Cytochrome P450 n=1 Tax=Apiospora phragmitis TaxID=2905665 RepID=A0ABR1VYH8_9PEZI